MADSDLGSSDWWSDPMLSFSADDESLSFRPPQPSPSAREADVAADPGELEIREEELPAEKDPDQ